MPYIFGYGSLVDKNEIKRYLACDTNISYTELKGFQRVFNVAMDNTLTIKGYKYYVDEKGERADVYVTFLNIIKNVNMNIIGSLFYVDNDMLQEVDKRERNYDRIKINNFIDIKLEDDAWVYLGKKDAIKLYEKGKIENRSVVSKSYYELVNKAYSSIDRLQHYINTTKDIDIEIKKLMLKTL